MPKTDTEPQTWLPLRHAAARLNVHPTTLRRWADNGDIPFLLTPGGHRRFAVADIEEFASSRSQRRTLVPVEQMWAEKAMTRTRRALAQPAQEELFADMTDDHRARHRQLGRQLMGLTLQYISSEDGNGHLLGQAKELGHEYGRISIEVGLPLTDALQAAIYFRDELIEVALQLPGSTQIRPEDNLRLMRRINRLLNVVHLAVAETYEEERGNK
jgi:excisionase family DNA binding protein